MPGKRKNRQSQRDSEFMCLNRLVEERLFRAAKSAILNSGFSPGVFIRNAA